jgi:hypothetical protein
VRPVWGGLLGALALVLTGDELAQRDYVRVTQRYTVARSYGSTRVEDLRQCALGLLD